MRLFAQRKRHPQAAGCGDPALPTEQRLAARRSRAAFTLIEVLVALAIFGLMAVALGAAYINLLKAQASLRDLDGSGGDMQWARAALLIEPDLAAVERGGDVVLPDGRSANWRATVTPTNVSDLFDVTLEMDAPPPGGTGNTIQSSSTLRLLRPTWSREADREKLRQAAKQRLQREREAVK